MQTQQIIEASATVKTIVSFKAGDVYKRVETDYNNEAKLIFGIVQSTMHNGTEGAISSLEYELDYAGMPKPKSKVFTQTKGVAIYPATPDEIKIHFAEIKERAELAYEKARDELDKAVRTLEQIRGYSDNLEALSEPETVFGQLGMAAG